MTRKIGTAVMVLVQSDRYMLIGTRRLPESNLIAVCDVRKDFKRNLITVWNKIVYRLQGVLENKQIEAVTICATNYLHLEMVIGAAKSGKRIAIEKPLCKTLKESDPMIRAVRKASLIFTWRICVSLHLIEWQKRLLTKVDPVMSIFAKLENPQTLDLDPRWRRN